MMRLCKLFESLNLKILSANITCVSGSLLHTLFVEVPLETLHLFLLSENIKIIRSL